MLILGIESSCDETAAAVVEDGRRVLSNVVASQIIAHQAHGGVVPELASRLHAETIVSVTNQALQDANVSIKEINSIAVTHAPGLVGALLVGLSFAKGLSLSSGKALIGVHHLRGHVASNFLTHETLAPPFLCLIVSGGHSHIVEVLDYTQFRIIGRTCDDAAGEALDKTARLLGLPYPGGVHLDRFGIGGDIHKFPFPRPKAPGTYDFSFSGLKTFALQKIQKNPEIATDPIQKRDFAASFQYAVADYLCSQFLEAAAALGHKTLAIAGGVSANSILRRELHQRNSPKKWELYLPDLRYTGDNAAMIAAQGYYELLAGNHSNLELNACPSLPITQIF